ncbi:MAG: hypothetical protein AAF581_10480 [Planctomycetota bacterium]
MSSEGRHPAKPGESRKPRRRAILVGSVLLLLLGCLLLAIIAGDSAPPDDQDLRPTPRPPIPDEQNAYVPFARAAALFEANAAADVKNGELTATLEEAAADRHSDEFTTLLQRAQQVLAGNNEVVHLLEEARQRPLWQAPAERSLNTDPRWTLWSFFDLWYLTTKLQGDLDEAALGVRIALDISRRAFDDPEHIWGWLSATQLWRGATERVPELLTARGPLTLHLVAIEGELAAWTAADVDWAEVHRREYADLLLQLAELENDPSKFDLSIHRFNYKPNRTRHHVAAAYRLAIAMSQGESAAAAQLDRLCAGWDDEAPEIGERFRRLLAANRVGEEIASDIAASAAFTPNLENIAAHTEILRTLFALRRFFDRSGRLPDDITQLVPQDLAKVPSDPYTQRPLGYSRKQRVVYSVGRDGTDDTRNGGQNSGGNTDDIVVPIPWEVP